MSSQNSPTAMSIPTANSILPLPLRSRRGSLTSVSGSSHIEKEQLSQALDAIHNSASQSESLTTFNDFAAPPSSSSGAEPKGLAGDLMQNGFSGLYSRLRGVVSTGKDKAAAVHPQNEEDLSDAVSVQSQTANTPTSKSSKSGPLADSVSGTHNSPVMLSSSSSRIQSPTATSFATSFASQTQPAQVTKSSSNPVVLSSKSSLLEKPAAPMTRTNISPAVVPALAPVNVIALKDGHRLDGLPKGGGDEMEALGQLSSHKRLFNSSEAHKAGLEGFRVDGAEASENEMTRTKNSKTSSQISRSTPWGLQDGLQDVPGVDGVPDSKSKPASSKVLQSAISLPTADSISQSQVASLQPPHQEQKRPAAIERITQSHLPGYHPSRASSTDRSVGEASQINTSVHDSIQDAFFSEENGLNLHPVTRYIPGKITNEEQPDAVSARLEQMRQQVLSKEFWMADEICKECFLCGDGFTAFRRKHHCRTCGCIFDSKCTSTISGERFGVQGTLRVCKTCLNIINHRHDSSGSDESADDAVLPVSFFQTQQAKPDLLYQDQINNVAVEGDDLKEIPQEDFTRLLATPMIGIPATRRVGNSTGKRSAVLEIDAPQLSRPSSSRSLKALSAGRPMSSGHRRNQSKQNFLGRFLGPSEDRSPFHLDAAADETKNGSRLPAFHDDNIIDPDLAPYMSDEGSSGDEQMSLFGALNSNGPMSTSMDNEKSGFGSLLSAGKKIKSRAGDKSISGASFGGRGIEEGSLNGSIMGHTRATRRRNLSSSSNNIHHGRGSPRQGKSSHLGKGFGNFREEVLSTESYFESSVAGQEPSKMIRSASMRDLKAPAVELNHASLHHVRRLLHQLLQDANIPNVASWEKALIPILLQCTDDVNPDVRRGDDIDVRHYVKLKKIPGGKPGDTTYVSGVVFTKNLALKSMARHISHPRIVIVSFPIEYQRQQQQFMSLEPVIAQEKEFLRNMVNRIASLKPQLVLVQKNISGLALQYLAEANIAVAYNVKQSVIEAVSRCAQTEIISSIDMVALKPVHVGKSAGFDVKTYVHNDIPGRKKSYFFISGCPKDLGCTIVLRGSSLPVLTKMKRITEFMVYVVYNLKLETCLMRDEFVLIPSIADNSGSLSPGKQKDPEETSSGATGRAATHEAVAATNDKLQAAVAASERLQGFQNSSDKDSNQNSREDPYVPIDTIQVPNAEKSITQSTSEHAKLISVHESHMHGSPEDAVPEDIPMPTFYSDMVAKHQTKILSASPFVKFMQPYLLMRAREQERRLVYLKRLRDQDTFEEQAENEKSKPRRFQLIQPEMVHETVQGAPKQIMEVLHAVHDAEYDRALHAYQTQKRQWENYIQGNLNLFDPYAHQNIVVLYTVVCTATTVPCAGPELLALAFYNEHETSRDFDPDCTLGQYVEDLCLSADSICTYNGCEEKMSDHHRTYVHGEARITVFIEKSPCKIKGLQESILMWSYCKICKKETQVMPMSESTWKYSFGKYLELSFWSSELHLRAGFCPHDLHRDHLRYFGYRNIAMRIHYDPIDLLEIVVPRSRITWKVDNDLRLKNELFTKTEERWNRFMTSVKSRIKGINIEGVALEKVDACKIEVDRMAKKAQDEHSALLSKLRDKYMDSKYYEIIPMNRAVRAMQEKVAEWDASFADFDNNFFPSEKDIRRLAAIQLKKIFLDRDPAGTSLNPAEMTEHQSDIDEKSVSTDKAPNLESLEPSVEDTKIMLQSVVEDNATEVRAAKFEDIHESEIETSSSADPVQQDIQHLDLAVPWQPSQDTQSTAPQPLSRPELRPVPTSFSDIVPISEQSILTSSASTLSEKVQQLRQASQANPGDPFGAPSDISGIPRLSDRGTQRKIGMAISPPINRTHSQPAGTIRQGQLIPVTYISRDIKPAFADALDEAFDPSKPIPAEHGRDKKLSERFGLGSLKAHRKAGPSMIPRSVQTKRQESNVFTLAKHFEQLSREFEKERSRDRKQRAAKFTQSRAFPRASSKPIVEVYRDVNEAVEERGPSDDDNHTTQSSQASLEPSSAAQDATGPHNQMTNGDAQPQSPNEAAGIAEETTTEAETDDNQPSVSQTASDDDGGASDAEQSIVEDMPGVEEIAGSLGVSEQTTDLDNPKPENVSVMKILSNFWAERSASGWTQLEYPLNASDHVFVDSDVIVREDEPSSLIAFALSSEDYLTKLEAIRRQGHVGGHDNGKSREQPGYEDKCEDGVDQTEVETSLLRATGTHLKYQFAEGSAKMLCKIFYAEQFDAVRRKCGVADRIVESLSRCLKWDSKGGKTRSVFLKTLDERLVLKSLSPIETQAFLKFAPAYFNIMAEALFHELPTVIAKMLGFFQIVIKNPVTGTDIKWDVLIMENLFYGRSPTRIFDLKGSMRNRKIQSTGEQNEVLLDENMVEFIYESPLFAREHSKKLLRASVWNDTLFLARQNVMDYSLMIVVDEARKELVVGIIDCIRTYTWDKKLESWIKDRGFAGGGRNRPTVTSPKEYKSRFREAMARYVLQAPNPWHQFATQQVDTRIPKQSARFELEVEGDANA